MDWRGLPLRLAATLAAGLPEDSRCRLKQNGQRCPEHTLLNAAAVDALHRIEWRIIGAPGRMPPSIVAGLSGTTDADTGDVQSYDSPEDFEAAIAALKGG